MPGATLPARTLLLSLGLLACLVHCGSGLGGIPETVPVITRGPVAATVTAPAPATFLAEATGSPAPDFQWYLNGEAITGATQARYTTPATTAAMNGEKFTVAVSNGDGDPILSTPAPLTVLGPPVIVSQPSAALAPPGSTATFSVGAAANPAPACQWKLDGTAIPGATQATYTTPAATLAMEGNVYSVTLTNAYGTVTSDGARLTVTQAPAITAQPADQTVVAPLGATFAVTATGTPLSYQWNLNGTALPGATSATLVLAATQPAMNGNAYSVTISAGGRQVTSAAAILTVETPAFITTQPSGGFLNPGAALVLSVAASGTPAPSAYQWYRNSTPLPGATLPTYRVANAQVADSGAYAVTVGNGIGSLARSSPAQITVGPTHAVSGVVTSASGEGVPGMLLAVNTVPVQTTTTDAGGNYTLPTVPPGSFTLTPNATGVSSVFYPPSQAITVAGSDLTASFRVALGYQVSGTVTYAGNAKGAVYVTLTPVGGGTSYATGLPVLGGGAFTIQGLPPGDYLLSGSMDYGNKGAPNASDPSGALAAPVTLTDGDLGGLVLALADPVVALPTAAPVGLAASPMASGAVVNYNPVMAGGMEQALTYTVEWSDDPGFATLSGTRTFLANPACQFYLSDPSLVDGTSFSFRIRGAAGTATTDTSNPVNAVIGPGAGPSMVSGVVAFAQQPTGTLYVGLYNPATGQSFVTPIARPISPQSFAISGVPSGASYLFFGLLDQNGDGLIGTGDPTNANTRAGGTLLAVAGDLGQDLTLPAFNSSVTVATTHQVVGGTTEVYGLAFNVQDGVKHVVATTLTEGPQALTPCSLASNKGGPFVMEQINAQSFRPVPGDTYDLQATYQDGTSEVMPAVVTTLLDSFPGSPAPTGTGDASGSDLDVKPTFTWTAPSPAPDTYTYTFTIAPQGGAPIWTVTGLSSTTAALAWATDPTNAANIPTTTGLTIGQPYVWTLTVQDPTGNQATLSQTYQP